MLCALVLLPYFVCYVIRFRVLALDHGLLSFVDEVYDDNNLPIVIVTNPKSARYIQPAHEPLNNIRSSTHIRFQSQRNVMLTPDLCLYVCSFSIGFLFTQTSLYNR